MALTETESRLFLCDSRERFVLPERVFLCEQVELARRSEVLGMNVGFVDHGRGTDFPWPHQRESLACGCWYVSVFRPYYLQAAKSPPIAPAR